LNGRTSAANQQLRHAMPGFVPFEVELGEVAVFESTRVIYLELLCGQHELDDIHRILNSESLYFKEPFEYHPHVTLAQGPTVLEDTENKVILARDRWDSFRSQRKFLVNSVTFVQNGGPCGWLDLDELPVGSAALEPSIL
jgi:2'-5' RNA ligase